MQSRFALSAITLTLACALAGCGASPNTVTPKRTSTATKPAATAAATKTTATAQTTTAQQPTSLQVAHQPVAVAPATTTASSTLATTPTTTAPVTTATTTTTTPVADVAPTTTTKTVGIESTGSTPVLTPTSTTSVSVASASALSAEITAEKNGVLLGMGSYKCTVTVSNSSDSEQTGMLQLTFMNGENPSKTAPVVQLVTIPAGGSKSFDFSDTAWSTDSAVVSVATTHDGQPMAAFVTKTKNGTVLGLGSYKCTVTVINPDDVEHTGNLVVTFLKGDSDSVTAPVTTSVTLPAHSQQTFDFSDPKWSTNGVEATIQ